MNWDRIEGNWKQFTGKVKEQWGRLTDDDIDRMTGQRDQLRRQDPGELRRCPRRGGKTGRRLVASPDVRTSRSNARPAGSWLVGRVTSDHGTGAQL